MINIFEKIKSNPLWDGIDYADFEKMFGCMDIKTRMYKKREIILLSGDRVDSIGLVLSGGVRVIKEDADGNITIITELAVSDLFGEALACAGAERSPLTVQAAQDSEILFLNYKKIIYSCSSACVFHSKLIENMLKIIANKNLQLNQKIEIISKRTTREKLLAFFDMQRASAKKFTIPYNREELAHFLCVDRSAMSGELCKMRDEGLIRFHKNKFEIL